MPLKLEDDQMCYVCGSKNAHGFKLSFEHPSPGLLRSTVVFQKQHQGYRDIVHGGLMATLLDEMIVNLAWKEGLPSVTAEITVRLKKPAKVGETVHLEGRLDERAGGRTGRTLKGRAEARTAAGELLATAEATCIRIKKELD